MQFVSAILKNQGRIFNFHQVDLRKFNGNYITKKRELIAFFYLPLNLRIADFTAVEAASIQYLFGPLLYFMYINAYAAHISRFIRIIYFYKFMWYFWHLSKWSAILNLDTDY